ncbi:hypothetical protein [Olleya sp. UBA1516]|uniref:hypothetical protein n=1 Tax=Olleya sp. UBA1516 TaxID=1947013 RepID=UPI0025E17DF3|nr:hypothetical protein [Olleya sp. UBA1516]|tara:strand:- start:240908 stop:241474 length:567 start_codon:yes stop_codon:yes gene_type:complete
MKEYHNSFEFQINNNAVTKDKLIHYFQNNNLKIIKDETDLVFEKKGSIFDGWKLNVLNWESNIKVKSVDNHKIVIHHTVKTYGFGVITPIAFSSIFETYIDNLKQYIINNESFEKKNNELVKLGRIKLLKYIVILILGILAGLYFGTVLKNLTHIKLFGYLGIFCGALITQIVINSYLIKNKNSKHLV